MAQNSSMLRCTLAACVAACVLFFAATEGKAANPTIRRLQTGANDSSATLRVLAGEPSPYRIPAFITGKFAEHLRENIYGGMCAEILRNPTLADYPFATREMNPDGVMKFYSGRDE